MLAATGVKQRSTFRAGVVATHVFGNGQFVPAYATQNGFLIKFTGRPNLRFVVGGFFMTTVTRKIVVAALEFDGDDIQFGMPVLAARLVVDGFAENPEAVA